jgi:hypothetical protein
MANDRVITRAETPTMSLFVTTGSYIYQTIVGKKLHINNN